jgi:predicted esterase YcpF (UPF0227 family)
VQRHFAVITTGDGLLSWREMCPRHDGAQIPLREDSDHSLSDFQVHPPHIPRFLQPCD